MVHLCLFRGFMFWFGGCMADVVIGDFAGSLVDLHRYVPGGP